MCSNAALRLESKVDELHARLQDVAQEGSPDLRLSRSPTESIESDTPPPLNPRDLEISSHKQLAADGGRPVCSIQEQLHILAEPMTRYEAVLSWLSDDPDSEIGDGDVKTIFTRQFARWWDFRKSQWDNRGLGDSEEGFSAFLKANRRRYEELGAIRWVSDPSFDETMRRLWQGMPVYRQSPGGQVFSTYSDAVKICLAPHHFTRPLELKENPHQQTVWSNWLEYLSYEKRCLETLTAIAVSLEQQYHQSWKRLLRAMQPDCYNAASSSAASDSTHTRQRTSDAQAINRTIYDFIRETKTHTNAQRAVYYQRHRVEWVVKEARLMESEMYQQSKIAKSNADVDTHENKKRQHENDENDEIPPESHSKRTKPEDGSNSAASDTTPRKPHTLRSTPHTSPNDEAAPRICIR